VEEPKVGSGSDPGTKREGGKSQTWLNLLQRVGEAVIPALLTAGGLIGFIAFAGSVIVWTRFSAAEVPPDQVVAAYPRGELVAVASALLLVFGFVGILAVVAFFLINRKSGATIGVLRGLLGLLAVEGVVAIFLVGSSSWSDRAFACELFLLPAIIAFWATFLYERPSLGRGDPQPEEEGDRNLAERMGDVMEVYLLRSEFVSMVLSTVIVTLVLIVATGVPVRSIATFGLAVIGILPSAWLVLLLVDNPRDASSAQLNEGEVPFTRRGQMLILILLPVAAIGPSLALKSDWLPFSLVAAASLVAALWRVAVLSKGKFMWYGLAVFISVPLFGTLTGVARNIADPQVQPMALIRQEDGPDEAIQGLYVTETDSRVYFAIVATEGCTDDLVPNSGRLLWVPKSDVVAMSVGPPQSVEDAAKTALEMSYALTPAVETPAGDYVSLTVGEKRGARKREQEAASQKRRLEKLGPAVQPNFGSGLRLIPENASPGDVVTLKMTAPNLTDDVEGFGNSRDRRTLRLGGVPVDILREEASSPFEVEYVESSNGRAINLVKDTLYVKDDDEYVAVEGNTPIDDAALFVKLNDQSIAEIVDGGPAEEGYLRLSTAADIPPRLAQADGRLPKVAFQDGSEATLKQRLLRQSWQQDRIKFRVPDHAATGAITVECEQLSGQPLLRVARPPQASIAVQIEPGSRQVSFDSSRSGDNGRIVSRQWWVEGVDRGKNKRIAQSLPPRIQSYSIRLVVTDDEGQSSSAQLHLLRLPAHLVAFKGHRSKHPGILRRARAELQRATAVEPAAAIEFNLRPGELPAPPNPDSTLGRAERVRQVLLRPETTGSSSAPANPDGLVVKTLAFGANCPAERESEIGRLDVLVLGEGVRVVPPRGCPVVRLSTARWLLPPP
jgi:hypothetical protein